MSKYVLDIFTTASNKTIRQHQILGLGKKDTEHFVDALLNSRPPSEQAIKDAQWYQQIIGHNEGILRLNQQSPPA